MGKWISEQIITIKSAWDQKWKLITLLFILFLDAGAFSKMFPERINQIILEAFNMISWYIWLAIFSILVFLMILDYATKQRLKNEELVKDFKKQKDSWEKLDKDRNERYAELSKKRLALEEKVYKYEKHKKAATSSFSAFHYFLCEKIKNGQELLNYASLETKETKLWYDHLFKGLEVCFGDEWAGNLKMFSGVNIDSIFISSKKAEIMSNSYPTMSDSERRKKEIRQFVLQLEDLKSETKPDKLKEFNPVDLLHILENVNR